MLGRESRTPGWERICDSTPNSAFSCASACLVLVPQRGPLRSTSQQRNAPISVYEALRSYHVRLPQTAVPVSLRTADATSSSWHAASLRSLSVGADESSKAAASFALQALLRHGNLRASDVPSLEQHVQELLRNDVYETAQEALEDFVARLPQSNRGNDGLGALRMCRALCGQDWDAQADDTDAVEHDAGTK